MNKTTRKLGKPLYVITLRCIWGAKPPDAVVRNWARLDKYAKQDHNRPYDALTDAQKVQIHYNLNAGIYREQEKKEKQYGSNVQKSTQAERREQRKCVLVVTTLSGVRITKKNSELRSIEHGNVKPL